MQIRHLKVSNFRGIKCLDWHLEGNVLCLVGPGDSTKTTILDAIECALVPRNMLTFSDTDFFQGNVQEPITILVTVGELPEDLLLEDKFGTYQRGYRAGQPIFDDPEDGWEPVLTVRLQVDKNLEPAWHVVKDSNPEPKPISWRDRERLSLTRLGADVLRHLTWGRGSALARLTGEQTSTGQTLATITRQAQKIVSDATLDELQQAAQKAQQAAVEFGVRSNKLRPGLDTQSMSLGVGALTLHDGEIPLRAMGLGTRRLAALAVQHAGLGGGAIVLIDEVEHGLEPHRIRQLLKKLCDDRTPGDMCGEKSQPLGQVIMTTHSPTPIIALPVTRLRFARCEGGVTCVERVQPAHVDKLQSVVRTRSHALLARKIIVCEGKTEEALCRALDDVWSESHDGKGRAYQGVVAVESGGSSAPQAALELRRLCYEVAFLGDSDAPIDPDAAALKAQGIAVLQWSGGVATEERVALDLPWEALQKLVDAAAQMYGQEAILNAVGSKLGINLVALGPNIDSWKTEKITEAEIRKAIGQAAKTTLKGWFKDLNAGEALARVVVSALARIPISDLAGKISALEAWVYA